MAYEPRKTTNTTTEINTDSVVSYLNVAFSKAAQRAVSKIGFKNLKGTKLHAYQVEFCYLIDEIQRGPTYNVARVITEANRLITSLSDEASAE